MFNAILRGWINYYGSYFKSALYPICDQLNCALKQGAVRKFKALRGRKICFLHFEKVAMWGS
jgi:RNA-directed DNA polymerase